MKLGAFSVSLAVKDIGKSRGFYEALGFSIMGGDAEQGWLIVKNGDVVIGLFQGMFESNMLTFNPGWDQSASPIDSFTDVRKLHSELQERGLEVTGDVDAEGTGPASFTVTDPDGNTILIDQHV
ncbi:MAG: VOC family protein [Pseudomonadota bacterium]